MELLDNEIVRASTVFDSLFFHYACTVGMHKNNIQIICYSVEKLTLPQRNALSKGMRVPNCICNLYKLRVDLCLDDMLNTSSSLSK